MNRIGKTINYTYRIVTVDGEILHTGGGLTGGKKAINNSVTMEKSKLESYLKSQKLYEDELEKLRKKEEKEEKEILALNEKKESKSIQINILSETNKDKKHKIDMLINTINIKEEELSGTKNIKNNSLDKELEKTLTLYYDALSKKDKLEEELDSLKTQKSNLNDELNDLEFKNKKANSEFNKKNNIYTIIDRFN